ncbi:alkali metal cation/H+ antiporter Nha1 C terminus-domain-containing protein [Rhexocercosporidium sp. MPI-PUGE-AT-0058]|nr:alkali metal cation/H+ antiporter Nha1 C terminus-domain-containing protein [Rhexocercosporidium sp. MPI-PUGE-AT-0058]
MAWDHLSINRPHLVYIILGGFTSLFMLCSSFIKERLYIGEATVATICGIIFGPHAANLIDPGTWGNTDQITLEFSRIVLVVQCFAVGVELPKYYMEKHWRSVVFLLLPVMTFGWLITSLFIWWMVLPLTWLEALVCAACVTATDPVLASSVVGKGKFAKRVPKHLRDLLSAESGCNDGMAFPFIYLALYLVEYKPDSKQVAFHWIVLTILYECVFGAFYGFMIGYIGRHGIKYAEKKDLVDRESFLVFYFVLALFCAGSGSILGVDDLLVGFAAGVGFSNDGWFTQKTEESHVSNVIDLLLNLAYFVYLGTIIPWEQYNNAALGLTPWRLVVIALFVIFFRRIPIMMALKPLIPDIKTWREALFAGHFGPIGVGAIFVAILARAELETTTTTPLAEYPDPEAHNYMVVALVWPITTFLVITSIIVHGSSIAVFTLGKHINTLHLTMSYTTDVDGPGWLNRLPRIATTSRSQAKSTVSETDADELKMDQFPPGALPPIGMPREFLRRQKEEDNPSNSRASSLIPRRRKKKWDDGLGPGGPISQSAIFPVRRSQSEHMSENTSDTLTPGGNSPDTENEKNERDLGEVQHDPEMEEIMHRGSDEKRREDHGSDAERHPTQREIYTEGDDIIIEDEDGEVVDSKIESHTNKERKESAEKVIKGTRDDIESSGLGYKNLKKKLGVWRHRDEPEDEDGGPKGAKAPPKKRGPALAYQIGNTIIVEDEDGEVVKTYEIPSSKPKSGGEGSSGGVVRKELNRMGTWTGITKKPGDAQKPEGSSRPQLSHGESMLGRLGNWGFKGPNSEDPEKGKRPDSKEDDEEDDRHIRFTIGGAGRRLTKDDFLKEIQSLDPKARAAIVDGSDAPAAMKDLARKDASTESPGSNRLFNAKATQMASGKGTAKSVGAEMARRRGAPISEDEELRESGSESDSDRQKRQRAKSVAEQGSKSAAPKTTRRVSHAGEHSTADTGETKAERRRREQALKGVDEVTPAQRGRSREIEEDANVGQGGAGEETAAERRRREAALGLDRGNRDDSDDDDTPRVPPPVAKSRGIRFAQSPVRGEKN